MVKDIALVGLHKIRVVERAGLFGGPQKWQRLCLAHRQFEGARDTLLLTHPFRQLVGVGSRHLPTRKSSCVSVSLRTMKKVATASVKREKTVIATQMAINLARRV